MLARLESDGVYGVYRYQGIPVPVPDAGIARETAAKARHRVENNRSPSRAAQRFWELSGGILRCEECGRAMQTHSPTPQQDTFITGANASEPDAPILA